MGYFMTILSTIVAVGILIASVLADELPLGLGGLAVIGTVYYCLLQRERKEQARINAELRKEAALIQELIISVDVASARMHAANQRSSFVGQELLRVSEALHEYAEVLTRATTTWSLQASTRHQLIREARDLVARATSHLIKIHSQTEAALGAKLQSGPSLAKSAAPAKPSNVPRASGPEKATSTSSTGRSTDSQDTAADIQALHLHQMLVSQRQYETVNVAPVRDVAPAQAECNTRDTGWGGSDSDWGGGSDCGGSGGDGGGGGGGGD